MLILAIPSLLARAPLTQALPIVKVAKSGRSLKSTFPPCPKLRVDALRKLKFPSSFVSCIYNNQIQCPYLNERVVYHFKLVFMAVGYVHL